MVIFGLTREKYVFLAISKSRKKEKIIVATKFNSELDGLLNYSLEASTINITIYSLRLL